MFATVISTGQGNMDGFYTWQRAIGAAVRTVLARHRAGGALTRHHFSEPLEPRVLLSSTSIYLAGTAAADSFVVKLDLNGNVDVYRDVPTTGLPTMSVPAADLTGVNLYGEGGGDSFTIDETNGDPVVAPFQFFSQASTSSAALNSFTLIDPDDAATVSPSSDGTSVQITDSTGIDDTISVGNIDTYSVASTDVSSSLSINPSSSWIDATPGANVAITSDGSGNTIVTDDAGQSLNVSTSCMTSASVDVGLQGTVTVDYSNQDPLPSGGLYANAGRITVTGGDGDDTLTTTAGRAVFSNSTITASTINYPTASPLTLADAESTDTLLAESGFVYLSADSTGNGPSVNVSAGATVYFAGTQHISDLDVQPGGMARIAQAGTSVLVVGSLELEAATDEMPGGILDVSDNDVIVQGDDVNGGSGSAGTLAQVTGWIAVGYDNDMYDDQTYAGPSPASIVSVVSAKITELFTAIGVMSVTDTGSLKPGLFDGMSVVDGDVVCRYTYAGDVNLDGITDNADQNIVDADQGQTGGWAKGDVDYSGSVSTNDYDQVYNTQWSQYDSRDSSASRPSKARRSLCRCRRSSTTTPRATALHWCRSPAGRSASATVPRPRTRGTRRPVASTPSITTIPTPGRTPRRGCTTCRCARSA